MFPLIMAYFSYKSNGKSGTLHKIHTLILVNKEKEEDPKVSSNKTVFRIFLETA